VLKEESPGAIVWLAVASLFDTCKAQDSDCF
jgi:hypothetical protein